MNNLDKNLTDVGRKPLFAIDNISQPIYNRLKAKIEQESKPILEENLFRKAELAK
jgi:hypothetical protein